MNLRYILAEYFYQKDARDSPVIPFHKQDSNVKDFYLRIASETLPALISGYMYDQIIIESSD